MRSLVLAAGLSLTLLAGCHLEDQGQFSQQVNEQRAEKDFKFKHSEKESPFLTKDERVMFIGLKYFPPEESYLIRAKVELQAPQQITIPDTRDVDREFYKVAVLHFTLQGKPMKLSAYQSAEQLAAQAPDSPKVLFVPFMDGTTGKESYGGGRYLDLQFTGQDSIILDFNQAYNPYCAYGGSFGCPIPPSENHLPIRVEAGERKFYDQ